MGASVIDVEVPPRLTMVNPAQRRPTDPTRVARWVASLADQGVAGDGARRDLHDLLLRAARHEIARRRDSLPHLRGGDFGDLAHQSADDALVAILAKLDDYRGESRFTTWAYKFALLEAAVKLRRRAWQGREVPIESDRWAGLQDGSDSLAAGAESRETIGAIAAAMRTELSPHQRSVLVAVTLDGVPIDVLAERIDTTRGALYKTIHDARRKLRAALVKQGLRFDDESDRKEVAR